ncbi:hypothetical protein Tsubulata_030845, partial [Turnera subulata]
CIYSSLPPFFFHFFLPLLSLFCHNSLSSLSLFILLFSLVFFSSSSPKSPFLAFFFSFLFSSPILLSLRTTFIPQPRRRRYPVTGGGSGLVQGVSPPSVSLVNGGCVMVVWDFG